MNVPDYCSRKEPAPSKPDYFDLVQGDPVAGAVVQPRGLRGLVRGDSARVL